jgi:hypothetical protein
VWHWSRRGDGRCRGGIRLSGLIRCFDLRKVIFMDDAIERALSRLSK